MVTDPKSRAALVGKLLRPSQIPCFGSAPKDLRR